VTSVNLLPNPRLIDCEQEEFLVAEVKKEKPKPKVVPSFKKPKKEEPRVYVQEQRVKVKDTVRNSTLKLILLLLM